MTANRQLIVYVLIALCFALPAKASHWELTPSSHIDTTIGDEIGFNLTFHSDETIAMSSWELDIQFDTAELAPIWESVIPGTLEYWKVEYNDFGAGFGSLSPDRATLSDDIYTLSAGSLSNFKLINPGDELQFVTFYMEVVDDQVWDDVSDVVLFSQFGTLSKGILDVSFNLSQYDGALGASVGSPVPVPAAVWLLGSGLMGIIGIRRRINK